MTAARNSTLGRYGESVAARQLTALGMTVIDRNWRGPSGEIDLVLRDGDTLVICEVKTRTTADHGHPLEAVSGKKAQRLRRLAAQWMEAHQVRPADVRIDVVGVLQSGHGAAQIEHLKGVC
ncbi:MAG: YraN family protein [Marmoricola sp.]